MFVTTGAGLRAAPAVLPEAVCRGDTASGAPSRLHPLTSAGDLSTMSDSCLPGSTQEGPPFLYTPVYVLCAKTETCQEYSCLCIPAISVRSTEPLDCSWRADQPKRTSLWPNLDSEP